MFPTNKLASIVRPLPLLGMLLLSLVPTGFARAELVPEEIALVVSRSSREAQALAKYYCQQRGVPEEHICLVDMPRGEQVDRKTWQWAIRPEIQKWLVENDPSAKLKCLVTVWDTPLKIAPAPMDTEAKSYQTFLTSERQNRLLNLKRAAAQLQAIANGSSVSGQAELAQGDTLESLKAELEQALQAAQKAIATMPAGEAGDANNPRTRAAARLQQLAVLAGGGQVLLQGMSQQLDQPNMQTQFDVLRGRASAFGEIKSLLDQMAPGVERDSLTLATIERSAGLIGSVEWLNEHIKTVEKNETGASFDSELSLVMWPDEYALLRWQPNYLRPGYDNSQLRSYRRTLMVARIDGPTLRIAKRLIDDAIAVEKAGGLKGKVYLDARGLAKLDPPGQPPKQLKPGSYEDYDRSLLVTAKGLREQTELDITLNEAPELFQPGDCPDAALYCGWYSLAKYVDAFEFTKGAVAFHLASAEARTLRDAESKVWCKRLLEEGVCATMGPVYEPYLVAYPRPNEFIPLLLGGDLTLVECYYRTKPFNSWMMTLVGDPLYRPYAGQGIGK